MAAVGERAIGTGIDVTTDDLWHLGSITKSMTATLAAVLVDEGQMRWDTTVAEVFSEDTETIIEKYRGVELQQLLSMTGGVTDNLYEIGDFVDNDLDVNDITGNARIELLPRLLSYDHGIEVGDFEYANFSYILASAMMEKTMGQSWRDLLTSKLMGGLNISSFGFGPPGIDGQIDQPLGHSFAGGSYQALYLDNREIFDPAGRVHMSMSDIAAYAAFQLTGKSGDNSLISGDVMQELYRGRSMPNPTEDPTLTYGLGWEVDEELNNVFHVGSNTLWYAGLLIDFRRDIAFFVVTNAVNERNGSHEEAIFDVAALIDERVGGNPIFAD